MTTSESEVQTDHQFSQIVYRTEQQRRQLTNEIVLSAAFWILRRDKRRLRVGFFCFDQFILKCVISIFENEGQRFMNPTIQSKVSYSPQMGKTIWLLNKIFFFAKKNQIHSTDSDIDDQTKFRCFERFYLDI